MDDRMIARWRLHTLRLAGATYPSAPAAVEGMLGVQAENYSQASWAVSCRTPGTPEAEFGRLFDDGAVLRTHVLRPTWHFVRPDDIAWLLELTGPRASKNLVQLQRAHDVGNDVLESATEAIADILSGGEHLTRDVIGERLRNRGLPAEGQVLGMMMFHAETALVTCSGATHRGAQTYAAFGDRAPDARRMSRDEALAEIVLRYFSGHGPATERDLAYWATLTLTDVRTGLAQVGDELQRLDHDGRTYWYHEPPPEGGAVVPRGHLLQTLDEYHNGYQDSRYVLDAAGLIPKGRRAAVGMALVDGQVVGDMRRSLTEAEVLFEVGLFRRLEPDELAALHEAADRYGAFLGRHPRLVAEMRG